MNIIEQLERAFLDFVNATYGQATTVGKNIQFSLLTDSQQQQFGDIASNAALILAKALGKNPREIAQQLATFKHEYIERIEIAGPGFVNFFLTKSAYNALVKELYTQSKNFFKNNDKENKLRFSVEFVSANPTGPLHLGHGRGGIIGDVLGNILQFLGHKVTKEYYINDAGSQIQKLGNSFKIRCQQQLGMAVELPEEAYHGDYLITLAEQAIAQFGATILNNNDEFFANYAKEHLLEQIKTTLSNYGINFDVWFSEKTLHTSGAVAHAINLLEKQHTTYEQEGALWFASTRFGDDKDRVLRKANGELTYIAADVAYTENKFERADRLIFVLGQDHHSYVTRLKGITQALGHNPDHLEVILYQLITLQENGEQLRMSKRAGTMVSLQEVIDKVGVDVARFFFLNRKADAHLDFNMDLALKKTEENPVYYLQYAYVRTNSILKKATDNQELAAYSQQDADLLAQDEYVLIKKIIALKNVLNDIAINYQTHLLTYYVIELAQLFHAYYGKNKIIDPIDIARSKARLLLVTIIRETLGLCLDLLGLDKPQSM